MASIAERLRKRRAASKAGRPRKENVDRYPSGKIKPAETEREAMSVAVEARMKVNGWEGKRGEDKAKSPYAGYTLGVLHLDGKISKDLLDAGDAYALAMARYYRLTGIPFPSARAQSLFSIKGYGGEVTDDHARRARDASNLMMKLQGILLSCVDGPQVRQTVHNVTVMSFDNLRDMPPLQIQWLKRGLLALSGSGALRINNQSATDIAKSEVLASA